MPKATPLMLVLILIVTTTYLSLRPKNFPTPPADATQAANSHLGQAPEIAKPAPTLAPTSAPTELPTIAQPAQPPVAPVAPRPWPQATSDIAPEAGATFGHLENGMRYIIFPHGEPRKRVSLRLHIQAGSLMEAEDQRGIAHFLEHMMFNGTQHFTADELIPRMQRLGISFGAHVNAFTSFDETVYMLDLPDLAPETLDLAFTVMRDFGDGARLATQEIDKERGVILAEKISRDSVNYRLMEQQFAKILPDSLITRRMPIGMEKVIASAPRERFVDLYSRFYTPARMTFVVVGEIEPSQMRERIQSAFGSMRNPPQPSGNPDIGKIYQPEGLETAVFSDKEVSSTDVALTLVKPFKPRLDTVATRTERMPIDIAHAILDRRFERIAKEKNSPVAAGSASQQILFQAVELGTISIIAADDRWQEVVPILEKEFRRLLQFGITESELTEAKSNLLNTYEQEVKQKATRKSENIASELAKSINEASVFSDPETDLAIAKRSLQAIDPATCHQAFKTFWEAPGYHLILTTKEASVNVDKDLAALYEDSRGTPVDAPTARATPTFDYVNFGKPGTITTQKDVPDLGISQWVLSNQVRVNLKRTDFEQGKIRLLARIGAGKLTQPKAMPMLDMFATQIFEAGGLGKHSNDTLQQILAGKNVSSSLTIGEDAFVLEGATTPADFTLQCQLMCASITDPGYRQDALWQFQKEIPMIYQKLNHTPAGPQQEMMGWIHGNDSRFTCAPQKKLSAYTLHDAQKWLTPELSKGYLELTIIGDFDTQKILPDLLTTFGALPPRAATAPTLNAARKIQFPKTPATQSYTYQSKIAQGVAFSLWKTAGIRGNQKEFRRLNLLANILGDRLRQEIREKLGAAYSPIAMASGSDALESMGYLLSQSIGKPDDLELLLKTMQDQASELATQGATADELDRALKPTLDQLDKSRRDNHYWAQTVMSQCQADPNRLELARTRDADYRSITLKEINSLATQYLTTKNALLVSIKPKE